MTDKKAPTTGRGGWFRERSAAIKYVIVFLVLIGVFAAVGTHSVVDTRLIPAVNRAQAVMTGWVLTLFGHDVAVLDYRVFTRDASGNEVGIEIIPECTPLSPCLLFLAAVAAFPAPLGRKIIGLLAGTAIIVLVNLVRVVSLYYVSVHWPDSFQTMHIDVWQPFIFVLVMITWVGWVFWALRRPAGEAA